MSENTGPPESPREFRTVTPRDLPITRFNRVALVLVMSLAGAIAVAAVWVLGSYDRQTSGAGPREVTEPLPDPEPWYEDLGTAMPSLLAGPVQEQPGPETQRLPPADDSDAVILFMDDMSSSRGAEILTRAISSVPVVPNGSSVRVDRNATPVAERGEPDRTRAEYLKTVQGLLASSGQPPVETGGFGGLGASDENQQAAKRGFLEDARADRAETQLPHTRVTAASPYLLAEGAIIPCVLEGGINSDLPGAVRARVRENVYDTATGGHLLIPQGTLLTGEYQSVVTFGQSRVLVVGKRMIFPDASSLVLQGMPLVDLQGFSGFEDQVDRHFWRTFGSAVLMSGISAGMQLGQGSFDDDSSISDGESPREILAAALAQQLGQVSSEMIRKNLGVQPTIRIRPGYRFNLFVVQDIVLPGAYEPVYAGDAR